MPDARSTMLRWLDVMRMRLRALLQRKRADRELDRELRAHIEAEIEELMARGMAPDEARRVAISTFGGVERVREESRDARGVSVMEDIGRDLRYAFRGLRREPMLLVAATFSIAVGAGGNLAVFSLAREFVFATPDVRRPGELVQFQVNHSSHASYRRWLDLDKSGALQAIAGYSVEQEINWRNGEATSTIIPMIVTANFFDVTGTPLAFGRGFTTVEAGAENDPRLAVVSHGFWQTRLGGDSAILGRALIINGQPYVVTGVLAPRLQGVAGFSISPHVYLPVNRALVPDLDNPDAAVVRLLGRLHGGQTLEQARAAVDAADRRLGRIAGDTTLAGVQEMSSLGTMAGANGPKATRAINGFFVLLGLVSGMVLLIACANVAGLLIARATRRRQEIAIRLAIGGTRGRLIQQFLVEGFWLALIGTLGGLLLSTAFVRFANGVSLPVPVPIELHLTTDPVTFLAAIVIVFVSIMLCGVLPALSATRLSVVPALKREESFRIGRRFTARGVLLTGQVTVSTVLLVTAFLFLRNLSHAHVTNPGFEVEQAVVAQVGFVRTRSEVEHVALLQRAVDQVSTMPGIEAAAYSSSIPLTAYAGSTSGLSVRIDGREGTQHVEFARNTVGPAYFSTLNVRVVAGREFSVRDDAGAPRVVIVNEEFARRYFERRSPVGSRIQLGDDNVVYDIVGMVTNGKHVTIGEDQRAAIYFPLLQNLDGPGIGFVVARVAGDPSAAVASIRQAVTALDGSISVQVEPMRSALRMALLPSQIGASVLGTLGILGLVLAAFGLYALVAYNVSRRVGEIAIRSALGATRGRILTLVIGDAAVLVTGGSVLGLAIAAFVTAPLSTFLAAGISARDPLSFGGTFVVFMAVAVLASWLPARQATRVAPVTAMRLD